MSTNITGSTDEQHALRRQRQAEEDARREALRPIERDESLDRTYIPMPGGFEVQTKGSGSSFRIRDGAGDDDFRLPVSRQPYLYDLLERMAKATHAEVMRLADALAHRGAEIVALRAALESLRADAERYRWLRDPMRAVAAADEDGRGALFIGIDDPERWAIFGAAADIAIDAAIAAQPSGGGEG